MTSDVGHFVLDMFLIISPDMARLLYVPRGFCLDLTRDLQVERLRLTSVKGKSLCENFCLAYTVPILFVMEVRIRIFD